MAETARPNLLVRASIAALLSIVPLVISASGPSIGTTSRGQTDIGFSLTFEARGLSGLAAAADPYGAQVLAPGSRLGIVLNYRVEGGDWLDLYQNDPVKTVPAAGTTITPLKSAVANHLLYRVRFTRPGENRLTSDVAHALRCLMLLVFVSALCSQAVARTSGLQLFTLLLLALAIFSLQLSRQQPLQPGAVR